MPINATNQAVIKAVISWAIALWASKVFLFSLPYKYGNHPDTQHIFGTIGAWMQGIIGDTLGGLFALHGAYFVGTFELFTSVTLLLPGLMWVALHGMRLCGHKTARELNINQICERAKWHSIGGLMACVVMCGAVFFHLFTPLGVEVLHQGQSDGGSLFYAAVSIAVLGLVLFVLNRKR